MAVERGITPRVRFKWNGKGYLSTGFYQCGTLEFLPYDSGKRILLFIRRVPPRNIKTGSRQFYREPDEKIDGIIQGVARGAPPGPLSAEALLVCQVSFIFCKNCTTNFVITFWKITPGALARRLWRLQSNRRRVWERGGRLRLLPVKTGFYAKVSSSAFHNAAEASLGIRQSPRGESATVPTFGPSGRQERLNCWEKNLR